MLYLIALSGYENQLALYYFSRCVFKLFDFFVNMYFFLLNLHLQDSYRDLQVLGIHLVSDTGLMPSSISAALIMVKSIQ